MMDNRSVDGRTGATNTVGGGGCDIYRMSMLYRSLLISQGLQSENLTDYALVRLGPRANRRTPATP
jgi:hypothetical protein